MFLKETILKEGGALIKGDSGRDIEVVVDRKRSNVVRFARSIFHQGVIESDCDVYVKVIAGKKVGMACTNSLDKNALKDCFKQAVRIAEHVKEEPFDIALPGPVSYGRINSYFDTTAEITDKEKVSIISKGFKKAAKAGVVQSGALTTTAGELAVLNSNGVEAYHPYTAAHLYIVSTKGEGASGFKSAFSKDISGIDIPGVMRVSAQNCLSAESPREIEPGVYRTLLEPSAVSELIHWLAYTGLGSKNFHEGTSFLSGRLGKKITGENVTIYDDGLDMNGMAVPFDMEGTPKRKVPLIEKGMARGVVYDSFTAALEGRATTGNAPFPEDTDGALPYNVFMEGGSLKPGDMLGMLGRGILVKSFHYVNGLLNPKETVMTGMTRHGTFFVDDGRIRHPVRPMRFTENIIKAFKRIEGISRDVELFSNQDFPLSSISVPYLLIDGFNFTS